MPLGLPLRASAPLPGRTTAGATAYPVFAGVAPLRDDGPACRICLDSEVTAENPLISPCVCKGTAGFVHRACLHKWRKEKDGTPSFYRCEVCHFSYQFRRLWHAAVLRHPLTSFLIFLCLLLGAAGLAGFAPLLEAFGAPVDMVGPVATHLLNGLVVMGLIGFLCLLIGMCMGAESATCPTCGGGGCSGGGCCGGANCSGGGDGCAIIVPCILAVLALRTPRPPRPTVPVAVQSGGARPAWQAPPPAVVAACGVSGPAPPAGLAAPAGPVVAPAALAVQAGPTAPAALAAPVELAVQGRPNRTWMSPAAAYMV
ncbi:hypothetical protein HYH03_017749 [Edaphochlamys debaryana]|uniref:RING-CH-type domain-containing protein n=1 Tax=Edaphochlamys debaryana TaxID=47281 RepID=A0A835XHX5_9CHLO|nr:hypothetical protein HYH03_017749 [Edaphochlamys debaryana]|eukprot:KAG2483397.1 hypothetical protein HYH03_017749 [Edaphochlamys debaryana]